jgi:hypothetical protein
MFGSLLGHIHDQLTGKKDADGNPEQTTAQRIGGGLVAAGKAAQQNPFEPAPAQAAPTAAPQRQGGMLARLRPNKPAAAPQTGSEAATGGGGEMVASQLI